MGTPAREDSAFARWSSLSPPDISKILLEAGEPGRWPPRATDPGQLGLGLSQNSSESEGCMDRNAKGAPRSRPILPDLQRTAPAVSSSNVVYEMSSEAPGAGAGPPIPTPRTSTSAPAPHRDFPLSEENVPPAGNESENSRTEAETTTGSKLSVISGDSSTAKKQHVNTSVMMASEILTANPVLPDNRIAFHGDIAGKLAPDDAESILERLAGKVKQAAAAAVAGAETGAGAGPRLSFPTGTTARRSSTGAGQGEQCGDKRAGLGSSNIGDSGRKEDAIASVPIKCAALLSQAASALYGTDLVHQGCVGVSKVTDRTPSCGIGSGGGAGNGGAAASFHGGLGPMHQQCERDESAVAGGSAAGGARLAELCREDKAKIARLMQAREFDAQNSNDLSMVL